METTKITFNDLPEVVAQLRDEVMSLKSLLSERLDANPPRANGSRQMDMTRELTRGP